MQAPPQRLSLTEPLAHPPLEAELSQAETVPPRGPACGARGPALRTRSRHRCQSRSVLCSGALGSCPLGKLHLDPNFPPTKGSSKTLSEELG